MRSGLSFLVLLLFAISAQAVPITVIRAQPVAGALDHRLVALLAVALVAAATFHLRVS